MCTEEELEVVASSPHFNEVVVESGTRCIMNVSVLRIVDKCCIGVYLIMNHYLDLFLEATEFMCAQMFMCSSLTSMDLHKICRCMTL